MGGVQFLGLTTGQLLTLTGLGVILLIALFTLSRAFKLTKTFVKLGCLAVIILIIIALMALWVIGN